MCGADGSAEPVCWTVRPSVNDAPRQQPGYELRRRRRVDGHGAAGDRSAAPHPERQTGAVDPNAQTAQRIQQWCDRPGPGLFVAVELHCRIGQRRQRRNKTQHRAGQTAIHPGARAGSLPLTVSSVPGPVDAQAQAAQRSDHQVGVAAAQRPADGRGALALRGRQRRQHQRPVGLRLRAGNGHRRVHRGGATGADHVLTGPSSVVGACRRYLPPWRHVWAVSRSRRIRPCWPRKSRRSTRRPAPPTALSAPNYNVAPTTTVATVVTRHSEPDDDPTRRVRLMRWGLIPPWVKAGPDGAPDNKGPLLINARADKVASSPAFRGSAKSKRCLVPMDGWYEWRPNPDRPRVRRPPRRRFSCIAATVTRLFMAGLWSVWKPAKDGEPLLSCTIITTDAVGELAEIHDRMPTDPGRTRLGCLAESRRPTGCRAARPPARRARHRDAGDLHAGQQHPQQWSRAARTRRAAARADEAAVARYPRWWTTFPRMRG